MAPGFKAEKCREASAKEKDKIYNRMTRDFANQYCTPDGAIDWPKLVEFVCGNMPH